MIFVLNLLQSKRICYNTANFYNKLIIFNKQKEFQNIGKNEKIQKSLIYGSFLQKKSQQQKQLLEVRTILTNL